MRSSPRKRTCSKRQRVTDGAWSYSRQRRAGWQVDLAAHPSTDLLARRVPNAAVLSLDHVVVRSSGRKNHAPSNLLTACIDCNRERGDRSVLDFCLAELPDPYAALDRVIDSLSRSLPR